MLKLRELSLKEAAAVSGMSVSALKVAVHQGRQGPPARLGGGDIGHGHGWPDQ